MQRLKCTIQYDGTNFSGFQVQPNKRTIQSEFELALQKMHKEGHIKVTPSGRTDSGVHAVGQVIHFDTPLQIEEDAWKRALNTLLPADIYTKNVEKVSNDFHARYNAKQKEYRYRIRQEAEPDIFMRNYVYGVQETLDVSRMREACVYFKGTHDFTSFSSARSTVKGDKVRTLYHIDCFAEKDEIVLQIVGSGFLYNMVRIIAGTLIEIGKNEREPSEIKDILLAKDRSKAGKTAPPQGLYLWKVSY